MNDFMRMKNGGGVVVTLLKLAYYLILKLFCGQGDAPAPQEEETNHERK